MNRRTFAATAIALAMTAAATAAAAAIADLADPAAAPGLQPERGQPVRSVIAPPKPKVETVVKPGLNRIDKHERLTDVLKARKRAGGTDRVAD